MMERTFSFKIERKTLDWIKQVAERLKTTRSAVIRDLVRLGLEIEKAGGLEIAGAFGLPCPPSKIHANNPLEETSVWLSKQEINELENVFRAGVQRALPQALRLAYAYIKPDKIKIIGKFLGIPRPLAILKLPKLPSSALEIVKKIKGVEG